MRGAHAIGNIPTDTAAAHGVILVDTTAWVEFDRATGSTVDARLSGLIADDAEVAVTEPVVMEAPPAPAAPHASRTSDGSSVGATFCDSTLPRGSTGRAAAAGSRRGA